MSSNGSGLNGNVDAGAVHGLFALHGRIRAGLIPATSTQLMENLFTAARTVNATIRNFRWVEFTVLPGPTRPKVTPSAFSSYVGVYCDPASHAAAVQPQTAAKGQTFQWDGIGSPAPAAWWVTVAATTCTSGSTEFGTRNNDPLTCTVAQTATTQNNYAVHVDGCTMPDSMTGMLTIQ